MVIGLACSCGPTTSSAPTNPPTPLATEPGRSAPPVSGLDLHPVDWREATMPGRACFQRRSIRLHHGKGAVYERPGLPSTSGERTTRLELATFNKRLFAFGDLEG